MKTATIVVAILMLLFGPQEGERKARVEEALKSDIPRMLCVNEKIATGGQPSDQAFTKLAAQGFRSVLNLRTAAEGSEKERLLVDRAGLRYINIEFDTNNPQPEAVNKFIAAVKNPDNHPMLIHCGSANRVGALWAIYRVLDAGVDKDKAFAEAEQIGLTNQKLKDFAASYIEKHKAK